MTVNIAASVKREGRRRVIGRLFLRISCKKPRNVPKRAIFQKAVGNFGRFWEWGAPRILDAASIFGYRDLERAHISLASESPFFA